MANLLSQERMSECKLVWMGFYAEHLPTNFQFPAVGKVIILYTYACFYMHWAKVYILTLTVQSNSPECS